MLFASYLVANARVLCEAVLYHGSLRFLAMNPAVLVILWIRLSVTFGYPATLQDIRTISKTFGDTPVSKGISDTLVAPSSTATATATVPSIAPSPASSPFDLIAPRRIRDDATAAEPDYNDPSSWPHQQRIISIVRVSSTSVVKPKIVVNKSNEISVSVKTKNKTVEYENYVTPFVSLLRKNRLDVDEDVPKIASPRFTAPANQPQPALAFIGRRYYNQPQPSTTTVASTTTTTTTVTSRKSKSSLNDTVDTEQYADLVTDRVSYERDASAADTSAPGTYDVAHESSDDQYEEAQQSEHLRETSERVQGEPERMYGEPEKVYGEPEKVYGEPEKVYGEPEKVYSEPEKIYGEPEKVYGEPAKAYGEPERVYGEPERIYGEPENTYEEPDKNYEDTEENYEESDKPYKPDDLSSHETVFDKHDNDFKIPDSAEKNTKSYSSFATKLNDKKSSYIVDNGTYRKYRVEEKTSDGFIVGEYGMVSHQDGSLRGVRYTADSNINPSLIYETLVKFLSLK